MDIFIQNVPPRTNHAELRLFLRDPLKRLDILAFDIFKKLGQNWAILTVANSKNGQALLQAHGGQNPKNPFIFKKGRLWMKKSNNNRPPDVLQVKAMLEKEATIRAKQTQQGVAAVSVPQSSQQLFSFQKFQTGVWHFDGPGPPAFNPKYLDHRQGTITCGQRELVVYLEATAAYRFRWHCRIDIPYSIIEHIIPSQDSMGHASVTLTLRSPPKIYKIVSTEDLHLYSGGNSAMPRLDTMLGELSLGSTKRRLERVCKLSDDHDKSSALCMVYNFTLPSVGFATQLWVHVSRLAALSQEQRWTTMIPLDIAGSIEEAYTKLEATLSTWQPIGADKFAFDVRFQLLALVSDGILAPTFASDMIPAIKSICSVYGPETTAGAIRKLAYQIPTPSPEADADEFDLTSVTIRMIDNAKRIKVCTVAPHPIQEVGNSLPQTSLISGWVSYLIIHTQPLILCLLMCWLWANMYACLLQALTGTTADINTKRGQHDHLISTYKVTITPTGMLLRGPDMNVSNRVLRKYADNSEYFMRVFFTDEDGLSVLHDPRASQDHVYARFHQILDEGITVAGRKYSFLGFSHSSLRSYTAWFMAPFDHQGQWMTSQDVISDLGDFLHIHCSAKCAARIGQAFTDTMFSVPMSKDVYVVENEPDVKRNGRCFSDGCGTISSELLEQVWRSLPPDRRRVKPTVLQIRFRGAKGVLSLDPTLPGKQLRIRESMTKYTARESWKDLEICGAAYKPLRLFLNHQFIKILEDLGIPEYNFVSIQKDALRQLEQSIKHPINAASFLEYSHSGIAAKIPLLFNLMHTIGINFQSDRFLTDMVEIAAMTSLRDLKYRARIPMEKGYLLYGIMDETKELKEGEVYVVTAPDDGEGNQKRSILQGTVVVTRAPALHPGDVQVVRAVDVSKSSPLRQLHNCIVFSQYGARDLPSQLGGGDLDGDLFHIIYDRRLIPPKTYEASDYPPTQALDLGRPAQIDDMVDFFVEYMNSDRLGQISNRHKIFADIREQGTVDPDCITLSKLASDAVDFSKSGKAVDMNQAPRGSERIRPDFMAPGSNLIINKGRAELEDEDGDDVDNPDGISKSNPFETISLDEVM